jgi:hypothetical protein
LLIFVTKLIAHSGVDKGKRIVLYVKDVQQLTGKGVTTSRMILKKIRQCKAKTKGQFVSIEDFAEFTGISLDLIKEHLGN